MKGGKSGAYRWTLTGIIRCAIVAVLLVVMFNLAVSIQVLAYTEAMSELWVGSNPPILVQDQCYTTATRQTLFHAADNVATDTESFTLTGTGDGGISLAQASAGTVLGSQTGFFTSSATSDLILPSRIGMGFMGTVIADPFVTGTFFGSGMIYPQMIPVDSSLLAGSPVTVGTPSGTPSGAASSANATGSNKSKSSLSFEPIIDNDLNVIMGYVNNSSPGNSSSKNATGKPAATPAPDVINPGEPLYHQQNKPFSAVLSWPSGPGKAQRSKVQNMTGFERFLMNTIARSTTDKAFNGTTSSPTYITPYKALYPYPMFQFINDAMKMTLPGTQLMNRAWPL